MAMIAHRLGFSTGLIERGRHPRFVMGESSTPLANLLLEEISEEFDLPFVRPLCKWGTWQKQLSQLACGLKRGFTFYHHEFGQPFATDAEHQHQFGAELGACPSCGTTRPEFIFDVLETPLRDLSGDIIYEENSRGQLVASRRYSPDFWRDKYEAFRLIQDVKQVSLAPEPAVPLPVAPVQRKRLPLRWHDEWTQFRTILRRSFLSKLRNRANLVITIGVSPVLALLISTIIGLLTRMRDLNQELARQLAWKNRKRPASETTHRLQLELPFLEVATPTPPANDTSSDSDEDDEKPKRKKRSSPTCSLSRISSASIMAACFSAILASK